MQPVTLYKKGVDPYVVRTSEEYNYHLNQGWVTDPELVEESTEVVAPPAPYVVGRTDDSEEVASLKAQLAAKDAEAAETQAECDAIIAQLNGVISDLKAQLAGGAPAIPPVEPPEPAGSPVTLTTIQIPTKSRGK